MARSAENKEESAAGSGGDSSIEEGTPGQKADFFFKSAISPGNASSGGFMAQDGETAYYVVRQKEADDAWRSVLYTQPLAGGQRQEIGDDVLGMLNLSGEWLYFLEEAAGYRKGYSIAKMKTDGSERSTLVETGCDCVNVVGEWVYFLSYDGDDREDGVYKVKTDGTGLAPVDIRLRPDALGGITGTALLIDLWVKDGYLYVMTANTVGYETKGIYRVAPGGGEAQQVAADYQYFVDIADNWIYYSSAGIDGSMLFRRDMDSEAEDIEERIEPLGQHARAFNTDGDWLYFADAQNGGALCRMKPDGGDVAVLCEQPASEIYLFGGGFVYFRYQSTSANDDTPTDWYRVPVDGGEAQPLHDESAA